MNQAIADPTGQLVETAAEAKGQAVPADTASPPLADDRRHQASGHMYAGREWTSEHPLNIRMSIPIGFGRYYITLVAGKERRARARLALDRKQNPLDTPGNVVFLIFVSLIATAGSLALAYLMIAHIFGWSGRLIF